MNTYDSTYNLANIAKKEKNIFLCITSHYKRQEETILERIIINNWTAYIHTKETRLIENINRPTLKYIIIVNTYIIGLNNNK